MSPARLWLTIFATGFAAITALLVIALLTPVPYGDLARTGLLSESDYGWRIAQPHVDAKWLRGVPPSEADVLVVGDSFSMSYFWQSVLARSGYRIATVYWVQIDETLCADFDSWVAGSGFHGRLVVIESVERLLPERIENTRRCARMKEAFRSDVKPYLTYPEAVPGFALNWQSKISSGVLTWLHSRKARQSAHPVWAYKSTLVRPVPEGCKRFSNAFCAKALFDHDDERNRALVAADVDAIRAFDAAHPTRKFLWAVIPNKTTVYLEPEHSRGFVDAFARSGLGPDLFAWSVPLKDKVRDFYFPNDTHLSMRGQLLLGERLLEAVRAVDAAKDEQQPKPH
ncbi:MAG TPA: hypothetical protein VGH80_07070 [Xanthomonadaceae bacterium]|jgi:hypothetical protein